MHSLHALLSSRERIPVLVGGQDSKNASAVCIPLLLKQFRRCSMSA